MENDNIQELLYDFKFAETAYQSIINLLLKQSSEFYKNAIESTQSIYEEQEFLRDLRTAHLSELENAVIALKRQSRTFSNFKSNFNAF